MNDGKSRRIEIEDGDAEEPEATPEQPEGAPDAVKGEGEADEQPATVEELEAEIERLEQALEEEHDRHLRAVAELQNFKRRAAREQAETARYASQDVLKQILPVMDNLQRVLEHQAEAGTEDFARGVELTVQEFFRVLEQVGVEVIEAEGERFDPSLHEAVAQVETDEVPEGTIVAVDAPGYRLHDRCLRPARVVVARGGEEAETGEEEAESGS